MGSPPLFDIGQDLGTQLPQGWFIHLVFAPPLPNKSILPRSFDLDHPVCKKLWDTRRQAL
jgi:hypothetical protein